MKEIWVKGIPFKMTFFMWKLWKLKVPVHEKNMRWGYQGPFRCWCCSNPSQEIMVHVFLHSEVANMTWSYFFYVAGINIQNLTLREVIMSWWGANVRQGNKAYYQELPSIIVLEIWKRRYARKHEGIHISCQRIVHNVTRNLLMLLKVRKPRHLSTSSWPDIF